MVFVGVEVGWGHHLCLPFCKGNALRCHNHLSGLDSNAELYTKSLFTSTQGWQ